jgi:phosphoglycolate phosphatase-like HAD superfamily hydrolase
MGSNAWVLSSEAVTQPVPDSGPPGHNQLADHTPPPRGSSLDPLYVDKKTPPEHPQPLEPLYVDQSPPGSKTVPPSNDPSEKIGALIFDFDGTMVRTYQTLIAFHQFNLSIYRSSLKPLKSIMQETAGYIQKDDDLMQGLLHNPREVFRRVEKELFGTEVHYMRHSVNCHIEESLSLYPSVDKILDKAKDTGVPVIIYTNTSPINTIAKLKEVGIDSSKLHALYCKVDKNDLETWDAWRRERAHDDPYLRKLRVYSDPKPNCTPVMEVQAEFKLKPENILFVGDGVNDFESCLDKNGRPQARFALHKQGAEDVQNTVRINKRLRKNKLGSQHFYTCCYKSLGEIMMLHHGFDTLIEMIDDGHVALMSPRAINRNDSNSSHDNSNHRFAPRRDDGNDEPKRPQDAKTTVVAVQYGRG